MALRVKEMWPTRTRSRHEEPEHLDPNLVWALRYAQTICHTNFDPCVQVLLVHAGNMYVLQGSVFGASI